MKTYYICEYCLFKSVNKKDVLKHEKDCPYNPADPERRNKQIEEDIANIFSDSHYD